MCATSDGCGAPDPSRSSGAVLAALRAAAAERLRPVCAGWPAERFATLVDDIAQFRLRWTPRVGDDRGV